MISQQKLHLFTINQQKILLLMHEKGRKLTFKRQEIYKANGSFKRSMRYLTNAGFVKMKKPDGNRSCNEYLLTFDGLFLVEDIIKHFIKCNKD